MIRVVVEKHGNYNDTDRRTNFKTFFFYDSQNRIIREKSYFFEELNTECTISDSLDFTDRMCSYDTLGNLTIEEIHQPIYNDDGKVTGRYLAYRKDHRTGEEETFEALPDKDREQ
jgi:hypothetical protein